MKQNREQIVVFIHGFLGNPAQFDELAAMARTNGWAVKKLLLPGHMGPLHAFCKEGPRSWQHYVDAQVEKLRRHYKRILLVGHSMGGLLAVSAACRDARQIAGVVAVSYPLFSRLTLRGLRMDWAVLHPPLAEEDARIVAARACCGITDLQLRNCVRVLPNLLRLQGMMRRGRKLVRRVTVPFFAVCSREDEVVSWRTAGYICRNVPQAELTVLEESGHFWYSHREQLMLKAVLAHAMQQAEEAPAEEDAAMQQDV